MIYTLENSFITISASTHGGELHSLKSKEDNFEYLWDGNPQYWKYHAPILFPIVGKVKDSKYRINNNEYTLPQHGLARISDFKLISKTNDSLQFQLNSSDETLKVYPYHFSLTITYSLKKNKLKVSYTVENLDKKAIFFSIGAHPAFMCPFEEDDDIADYYFEFNENETSSIMPLNNEGYFLHEKQPFLINTNIIPLRKDIFKRDALVFSNLTSNLISIKSKKSSRVLTVDFNDFPYLGLWAPASGAPFVCIEPWFGHADYEDFSGDLNEKEGIISLDKGNSFNCSFSVTV